MTAETYSSYGWKDHSLEQPKPYQYTVLWVDDTGSKQVALVQAYTAEQAMIRVRNIAGFECFAQVCKIERVPL